MRRLLLLIAPLGLAGCLNVAQDVNVKRDLSGSANVEAVFLVDVIATNMARAQKMIMGAEGVPTDEEVAAARMRVRASLEEGYDEERFRAQVKEALPQGVELTEFKRTSNDQEIRMNIGIKFDHVSKLSEIKLDEGHDGPVELYEGMQFVDEGDTYLFTATIVNPRQLMEDRIPSGSGMDAFIDEAFAPVIIAYRVQTPFEVIDHNATSVDGHTLIFMYTGDDLLKDPQAPRAQYKKP